MAQTNIIAGCAIVAFIIFVTVKGELPTYLGFLVGAQGAQADAGAGIPANTTQTGSNTTGSTSQVASAVMGAAAMGIL